MGASQRRKGAAGEREACAVLSQATGEPWERTGSAQRRKGSTLPDVRPVDRESLRDLLHVEVKRGAKPSPTAALRQAEEVCHETQRVPVALTRADRGEWLVTVRFEDLQTVAKAMGEG